MNASLASRTHQVEKHRFTGTAATRRFGRVHRLQLGVLAIKLLQRADGDELALLAQGEERQGWVEAVVDFEGVNVLRRGVLLAKAQMTLEQLPYVVVARVYDSDQRRASR